MPNRAVKSAFVTGAAGFIGRFLCRLLLREGIAVRALIRNPSQRTVLEGLPIEWVEGDLSRPEKLREGMRGTDTVFHIAALFRATRFEPREFWEANVEGTRRVLDIALEEGVGAVIHCSTTGVLGDVKEVPATPQSPYAPLDLYQKTKTEAEILALDYFRQGKIPGVVIRPAMVWGPEDTRLFKLFKGVATRRLPCIGDGKTWCHWVHVEDVARGFLLAAQRATSTEAKVNGQVYTVAGEVPVSIFDTMRLIAAAYSVPLLPFKIPLGPLQVLGDLTEVLFKPFGVEPPLHRRRVDFFAKNRCFDCSSTHADLGYTPSRTLVTEVVEIARWYVANDWLVIPSPNKEFLFSDAAPAAVARVFATLPSLSISSSWGINVTTHPAEGSRASAG